MKPQLMSLRLSAMYGLQEITNETEALDARRDLPSTIRRWYANRRGGLCYKLSSVQPGQVEQLAASQGSERRSRKHCDVLDGRAAMVTLTNGMAWCMERFVNQEAGWARSIRHLGSYRL